MELAAPSFSDLKEVSVAKKSTRRRPTADDQGLETAGSQVATAKTADAPWKMPQPCRGQAVVFYYRSTVSERNADMAFVTSVGEKSIDVAFRGQGYAECMHISDPRLEVNPELRQEIGGVWKFTDEKTNNEARMAELEDRVHRLENMVGEPPKS